MMIKNSRQGGTLTETRKNFPETALLARQIYRTYKEGKKEVEVLKGIDLEIRQGEIIAIMGASGAGKSTLLHILGLMDQATSGELNLLGWDIHNISELEKNTLRNKYIGFLFQFHYLLPELTLLENATLPQRILGIGIKQAEDRAKEFLSAVGLAERMDHYPSEVSGGEQQRAALTRAMINRPAILICDEPTGNLDLERGEEIRNLIWRVARAQNTTVLLATHNPDIAQKADRTIQIMSGKILELPQV